MDLRQHLARIHSGPAGAQVGAFFDFDGTLVGGFTAHTFFVDRLLAGRIPPWHAARTMWASARSSVLGTDPTQAALLGFEAMRGQSEQALIDLGERLFAEKIAASIRPEARALVAAHLEMGHTVAVATASSQYQAGPTGRELGIPHLVCSRPQLREGRLTGRLEGPLVWGDVKAQRVREFAAEHHIDLAHSYGYGNGREDVALLRTVGIAVPVSPHAGLVAEAERAGWSVLDVADSPALDPASAMRTAVVGPLRQLSRVAQLEPVPAVRTVAALAGFNAGLAGGLAVGLVSGERKRGAMGVAYGCDAALRLAGVRLNVRDSENLQRSGPAVVVVNHQSAVDPILVGSLVRGDVTVVAKKETRFDPRTFIGTLLLNPAFVDRGNTPQALEALGGVVDRLRSGTTVVVFPEGTRHPAPTVGPFRKGAFHLAIQAGVPVIPIVLRNSEQIMGRGDKFVRPGVVDVRVLEPITDWSPERLNEQVAALRQRYVDLLADWGKP